MLSSSLDSCCLDGPRMGRDPFILFTVQPHWQEIVRGSMTLPGKLGMFRWMICNVAE